MLSQYRIGSKDDEDAAIIKNKIFLYPNPAKNMVYVLCQNITGYNLSNVHGVTVLQGVFDYGEQNIVAGIDLKTVPAGVYMLNLQHEQKQEHIKLVVVK